MMTDFHMPDGWYDPPEQYEPCPKCEDEGCIHCDEDHVADLVADLQMQAMKEGEL
jgi:hypothetical protein